jgi:capsular polysaccharide biosynthesis protein
MEYKNIRLIIIAVIAFTLLTTGCSISITRNYYSAKPKTPIKTDSTTYVLKLGSQTHKPNDEQR